MTTLSRVELKMREIAKGCRQEAAIERCTRAVVRAAERWSIGRPEAELGGRDLSLLRAVDKLRAARKAG